MNKKIGLGLMVSAVAFGIAFYNFYKSPLSSSTTSIPHEIKTGESSEEVSSPEILEAAKGQSESSAVDHDEILELADSIQKEGWKVGCAKAEPRLGEIKASLLTQTHTVNPVWEEMVFVAAGCLSEIHLEETAAIEILKKALELKPRDAQFINMLGTSYFRSGQDIEAEEAFASVLADEELSKELWSSGWAGAVHEKLAIVKLRLGTEAHDTNRLNEARKLLQTADEFEGLTNVSPLRHGQIAAVDFSLGEYDKALAGYDRALSLLEGTGVSRVWSPEMISKMKAEYTMERGQIYFIQGQTEQAGKTMQQAIEYAEKSADPLLVQTMKALQDNTLNGTPVDLGKFSEIKRVPLE